MCFTNTHSSDERRTGSGKTTLTTCLLRFIETESGSIVLDGLDISKVKLSELRKRITTVPQDSSAFAGTVRFNLDPTAEEHDDASMWDALRRVGLADEQGRDGFGVVKTLDDDIAEGAKNLSSGQRQLLSLARGLLKLRNSSILVLDEASASLDNDTDEKIQRTIRQELGSTTLLCIAHRLLTIADFDRVLVLGNGELLEFDTPAKLLADDKSAFSALARRSGDYERIRALASSA